MPSISSDSGCSDGNAPRPISVVVTGICVSSASSSSSALASAEITPPPT